MSASTNTVPTGDRVHEQPVQNHYIRATNLPPSLRGWKSFKDLVRDAMVKQPGWVRTSPEQKSGDCTVKGRRDAELAFSKSRSHHRLASWLTISLDALHNYVPSDRIQVVMWDITDSSSPVLLRQNYANVMLTASSPPYQAASIESSNQPSELPESSTSNYSQPAIAQPTVPYGNTQPPDSTYQAIQYSPSMLSRTAYSGAAQAPRAAPVQLPAFVSPVAQGVYGSQSIANSGLTASTSQSLATCVYIYNLSKDTSLSDLDRLLHQHGVTGHSQKGIFTNAAATIVFPNHRKAERAVALLHQVKYRGKKLRVVMYNSLANTVHPQSHSEPHPAIVNGSTYYR